MKYKDTAVVWCNTVGSNIRRTTSKYDTREAEKPIVRCVQPGYGNPMQMTELSEVSDEGSAHFIGTFRGQLRAEARGRKGNGTVHAALRYVVLLLWLNVNHAGRTASSSQRRGGEGPGGEEEGGWGREPGGVDRIPMSARIYCTFLERRRASSEGTKGKKTCPRTVDEE
ncbi:hypothetical protein HZH66_011042 [Vespula vulgaris]|uniref:Uncharacterized protein n=1 Tax=Vespula vulgaris TaxID=7454 RepID=A0A834JEL1_VESVU|nr:hypothetical protein HZH66_011042 [Vespula vulgaris]